ncbi:hypothetical protein P8609_13130 [Lysobacter sp. UC]|uniref:Uncharacterized protein n=1 Tax=Lysobacter arvi TaxID=3038776 RepID=A0ABU1CG24_9GAMM|nr:hypothetical protein [Lysobacter arvi]
MRSVARYARHGDFAHEGDDVREPHVIAAALDRTDAASTRAMHALSLLLHRR